MATNVYIKSLAEKLLNQRLLEALAISSFLFFLSLIASVIHNLAETKALHFEYLASEKKMWHRLAQAGVKELNVKDLDKESKKCFMDFLHSIDDPLGAAEAGYIQKATRYRTFEYWISLLAVISFILGYLPVIGFVFYLARI